MAGSCEQGNGPWIFQKSGDFSSLSPQFLAFQEGFYSMGIFNRYSLRVPDL
jgi:hypothetical protein